MNYLIAIFIAIFSSTVAAEFRGSDWGTTINEVKMNERSKHTYPVPSYIGSDTLKIEYGEGSENTSLILRV